LSKSTPLPPTPPARSRARSLNGKSGQEQDLAIQLAVRVSADVLKRDLSPLEVSLCDQFIQEYAYLGVDDIVQRMQGQLEWGKAQKMAPPASLSWFTQSLRLENDHRSDAGQPKAFRPPPVAGDLSALKDRVDRDPDDVDPDQVGAQA